MVSKKWKQVRYAMLALTSYEQSNGFSAVTADELYFINGGSGVGTGIALIATGVGLWIAGMGAAASTPATNVAGGIAAAESVCAGTVAIALGIGALTGSYDGNYAEGIRDAVMPTEKDVADQLNK